VGRLCPTLMCIDACRHGRGDTTWAATSTAWLTEFARDTTMALAGTSDLVHAV
jgi:phage tail tape-measure protein